MEPLGVSFGPPLLDSVSLFGRPQYSIAAAGGEAIAADVVVCVVVIVVVVRVVAAVVGLVVVVEIVRKGWPSRRALLKLPLSQEFQRKTAGSESRNTHILGSCS